MKRLPQPMGRGSLFLCGVPLPAGREGAVPSCGQSKTGILSDTR